MILEAILIFLGSVSLVVKKWQNCYLVVELLDYLYSERVFFLLSLIFFFPALSASAFLAPGDELILRCLMGPVKQGLSGREK